MRELRTKDDVRKLIEDYDYEDILIFSSPDYASAFIGISDDNRAVYDYDKMIDYLVDRDGITDIEAIEFIDYNTIRALPYSGENAPIIVYNLLLD